MIKDDTYRNEHEDPKTDQPTVVQAIKLGFDPWLRAIGKWWEKDGEGLRWALYIAGTVMGGEFVLTDLLMWAGLFDGERMPRAVFWASMACFVLPTAKWWMSDMYVRGVARWEDGKR